MADYEEAVVLAYKSLVFRALDLHQSQEQLLEKLTWTCPPQSLNIIMSYESRLSRRACCAVLSDKRGTARHDFYRAKMHVLDGVSCGVVMTQQVEFGLYRSQ